MTLFQVEFEDRWLVDYGHIEQLVREVTETVTQRRQTFVGTVEHALLSNKLRNSIPQVERQVDALISRLDDWELRDLTPAERERRIRLCEKFQSAIKKAHMDFNERKYRSIGPAESAASGWGVEEDTDDTSILTADDLRQQQQRLREEQDSGLETLSQVISQQKRIASAIGTEVDGQNDILDEIADRTDNTHNRLVDETGQISVVTEKSRTWPFWLVIGVLFLAIIIVAVW
ncbi:syntaxin-8-like [Homarus americanus]|uniref:syntaxin-8-like n=1 Tax=Homarus americanus TaxID=6706 RepID=UPI001C491EBF|nr:syntaxin-8-like [Homarus americanus]